MKVVTRLDVTEPDSFTTFLDLVERELGPLDILINNAGIMPTGHAHEEDDAVTRRQVEINVLGVIFGTKLALQRMLPRRTGHIINTASLAGELAVPGLATYCATKFAVIGFTEAARLEYRKSGVRLSTVRPDVHQHRTRRRNRRRKGITQRRAGGDRPRDSRSDRESTPPSSASPVSQAQWSRR